MLGEGIETVQFKLVHHRAQTPAAGLVARGERIEIALQQIRLTDIGADDIDQRPVDRALVEKRHDRHIDAFFVDLPAVGAEAETADVDDVRGRGEQGDQRVVAEARGDHGEIVQMTSGEPRIVGDVDVAPLHGGGGKAGEKVADRGGHRVDMTGGAGDRLGEHAPLEIEHPGGQITGLAHSVGKRGTDQRLRLLLDDGDQAVPHDLGADLAKRGGLGMAWLQFHPEFSGTRRAIPPHPSWPSMRHTLERPQARVLAWW